MYIYICICIQIYEVINTVVPLSYGHPYLHYLHIRAVASQEEYIYLFNYTELFFMNCGLIRGVASCEGGNI